MQGPAAAPVHRVGFAGLGALGAPMAERIRAAGYELHVWNRSAGKAAPLIAAGACGAPSPAVLAQRVELLCICVTDEQAVQQLLFGDDGLASAPVPGLIVADHSTIAPLATRRIAARAASEAGIAWVDAPVSGGPPGARQGTLAVFAGGDAPDVERARPVLMRFAGKLTHLGAVGSGQAAKVCNQMISFGTCAVMAEALHLAARMGLDVARLPEAVEGGLADSAVLRHYAPQMLGGDLRGNSRNALKDIEIALELGRESTTAMPMTALLASLHRLVVAQGHTALGMGGPLRLYTGDPLTRVAERARMPASGVVPLGPVAAAPPAAPVEP